jgi:hypothetical protein
MRISARSRYLTNYLLAGLAVALTAAGEAEHPQQFSRANTLLFMTDHVVDLPASTILPYHLTRISTLGDGFEDDITVRLISVGDDGARNVAVDYFTGPRERSVPTFVGVRGNPVLTLFLQRDINEMARQSRGRPRHFQTRIKRALEESARVEDTRFELGDRELAGQKITIDPFRNDPDRGRYEKFADKTYEFIVSPEVPGFIFQIRSRTVDADGKEMILEVLEFRGKA